MEQWASKASDLNSKVAAAALDSWTQALPSLAPLFKVSPGLPIGCPLYEGLDQDTGLRAILGDCLKHFAAQLPSKNADLRSAALKTFDTAIKHIGLDLSGAGPIFETAWVTEPATLITPFAAVTKGGNQKQQPELLPRLARPHPSCAQSRDKGKTRALTGLADKVKASKPKLVEKDAVPIVWDILKANAGDSALKQVPSIRPPQGHTPTPAPPLCQASKAYCQSLAKTLGTKSLLALANSTQRKQLEELLR